MTVDQSQPAIPPLPAKSGATASLREVLHRPGVPALFLMCSLAAVDGTIALLAAGGRLATPASALAVGLTTVAGAGAWIASRQAFGGRRLSVADAAVLGLLGGLTLAVTVLAAALGARLAAVELLVLPKAAGGALLLVAGQVAGLRMPRLARVPLPLAVAGAGALLEVLLRWTP